MKNHINPKILDADFIPPLTLGPLNPGTLNPQSAICNPHSNRLRAPCSLLHASEGTTLLEVMIAAVIFMIGMLALLGMQVIAMQGNKYGQNMSEATALISDQVEQLWLTNTHTLGTHSDPNNPVDVQGHAGGRYTRTWTVATDSNFSDSVLIAITVSWQDIGKTRSVNFSYAQ